MDRFNCIHDTYGRFPGGTDAIHLMGMMQAHHIDTDYYDKFFGPAAYGPAHAAHMTTWHRVATVSVTAERITRWLHRQPRRDEERQPQSG